VNPGSVCQQPRAAAGDSDFVAAAASCRSGASVSRLVTPAAAQEGWGDDEADAAPLNRDFDAERYEALPLAARRNLARVDETRIDYDLLEELVAHIDEEYGEGAVLVFLPGEGQG
jgi:hypothetical protein